MTRPNIRIVRASKEDVPEMDDRFPYRFILTIGYEEGVVNTPLRFIEYCPYCGKNLKKYYRRDEYINESNLSFLHFK